MEGERWSVYIPAKLGANLKQQAGDRSKSEVLREVVREYYEQRDRRLAGLFAAIVALVMTAVYILTAPSYAVAAGVSGCLLVVAWGGRPVVRDLRKNPTTDGVSAYKDMQQRMAELDVDSDEIEQALESLEDSDSSAA